MIASQRLRTLRRRLEPVGASVDRHGVPHVAAEDWVDAAHIQGFVHGAARPEQLRWLRRDAAGELSSVHGPRFIDQDLNARMWRFAEHGHTIDAALPPPSRLVVDAYASGVNRAMQAAGVDASPWTGADTCAIALVLQFRLARNAQRELARHSLTAAHGRRRPIAAARSGDDDSWLGSNAWAVTPDRAIRGAAMLGAATHLPANLASRWYMLRVVVGTTDAVGATIPGVPGMLLGATDHLAWALVNAVADSQDVDIVETGPGDDYFVRGGRRVPFEEHSGRIEVFGSHSVEYTHRSVAGAPVVTDVGGAVRPNPLAVRWSALDRPHDPFCAFLDLPRAESLEEAAAAAARYEGTPVVYLCATPDRVGRFVAGRVPIRVPGHDGRSPVAGDGSFAWSGHITAADLPREIDPVSGLVVAANEPLPPSAGGVPLGNDWDRPFRFDRIMTLLGRHDRHDVATFANLHDDVVSAVFLALRPTLEVLRTVDRRSKRWRQRLLRWDGSMTTGSREATVIARWQREIVGTLSDARSAATFDDPGPLVDLIESVAGVDDGTEQVLRATFEAAAGSWRPVRWGRVHRVALGWPHGSGWHRRLTTIPWPGDSTTIDLGSATVTSPSVREIGNLKLIVDFADRTVRYRLPMRQLVDDRAGWTAFVVRRRWHDRRFVDVDRSIVPVRAPSVPTASVQRSGDRP